MEFVNQVIPAVVMKAAELLVDLQEVRRKARKAVGQVRRPHGVPPLDAFVHVTQQDCESKPLGAFRR